MPKRIPPEERMGPRFHKVCGEVTLRRDDGTCIPCQSKRIQDWTSKNPDRSGIRLCKRCDQDTPHDAKGRCIPCRNRTARKGRPIVAPMTPEELKAPRLHRKCGNVTPRDRDGTCIPCKREYAKEYKSQDHSQPRWCDKCERVTERKQRDGSCVPCYKIYQNTYDAIPENRDIARQRTRQWRQDYPEWNRANIKAWEIANPERTAEIRRQTTRRRQARKIGNGWEPYEEIDIFIRDEWICHLGKQSIDPSLSRRHMAGATIDHLVAVSRGGPDTPDNVAAAHFICNVKRGNIPLDQYVAPPCEELLVHYLQK